MLILGALLITAGLALAYLAGAETARDVDAAAVARQWDAVEEAAARRRHPSERADR